MVLNNFSKNSDSDLQILAYLITDRTWRTDGRVDRKAHLMLKYRFVDDMLDEYIQKM